MASQTLSGVEDRFPVGTTVYAYRRPSPGTWNGTAAPPGAAVESSVVGTDGRLTFDGLTLGVWYTAWQAGRPTLNFLADTPDDADADADDGVIDYRGTWNAATNTPELEDGTGTEGWFYQVSTAGTADTGGGDQTFAVGDFNRYESGEWTRVPKPA